MPSSSLSFHIRMAAPADAAVLARHVVEMYADMGVLPPALYAVLERASRDVLGAAVGRGDYVGWVAAPADAPDTVVAGAGLHLRPGLPRLRRRGDRVEVTAGPQGVVCNVFTERAYRRRGLAAGLVGHALAWAEAHDVPHVFLHASDAGRALYERLGFLALPLVRYYREL